MLTKEQLELIHTRLVDKMLGKLNMRWKKSGAYIPPGGSRVHVVAPLNEDDQRDFDVYLAAYRDAIEDFMGMLDSNADRPFALIEAENSVFQGGSQPKFGGSGHRPQARKRGSGAGRAPGKPAPRRGVRRNSAARAELEALFKKGGGDDV